MPFWRPGFWRRGFWAEDLWVGNREAPAQTELPIHVVQTRSIDAKTIADRFNSGLQKQEDYVFTGGRKFYQRDDN